MPGTGPSGQLPDPPVACQRLMVLREERQKSGLALQAARKRKPAAGESCELFNSFVEAESKFVRGLEDNKAVCGVPDDVVKRTKAEYDQVMQIRNQVCDLAGRSPPLRLPARDDYFLPRDIH
jgi:hypothetical protein